MGLVEVIGLDEPRTWPAWLRALMSSAVQPLSDLAFDEISAALAEVPVRLYHATRLTGMEVSSIRTEGLRRTSQGLVRAKVAGASRQGILDRSVRRRIVKRHVADHPNRQGLVWFTASRSLARHPQHDLAAPFFNNWGGQATWLHHDESSRSALQAIGRPSLVVATVPPGWLRMTPTLGLALWQTVNDPKAPAPIVSVAADVPASMIEDVLCADSCWVTEEDDPFRWPSAAGDPLTPASRWQNGETPGR